MIHKTRRLSALLIFFFWSLLAFGHPAYDPKALVDVLNAVKADSNAGVTPVVVFDLDDTLMDTGSRNVRIFKEFASDADIQSRYPVEAALLAQISLSNVQYLTSETLSALGITNQEFAKELNPYWAARFFTDQYCATDIANPGGVQYVNALWNAGATIVYLTGRDEPGMSQGTQQSLRRSGFPLGKTVHLMLKPDKHIKDIDFKVAAFKEIQAMGHVVGAFENEPANVNAYLDSFKEATAVYIDTRSSQDAKVSSEAVQTRPEVRWVKTFYGPWSVTQKR